MDPIRPVLATASTDAGYDHALLVAGAAVSQASSPTALLAQRIARQSRPRFDNSLAALVGVFATPEAGAGDSLDGSFHPHVARGPVERRR